jgi:hypothetical protein
VSSCCVMFFFLSDQSVLWPGFCNQLTASNNFYRLGNPQLNVQIIFLGYQSSYYFKFVERKCHLPFLGKSVLEGGVLARHQGWCQKPEEQHI